MKNRFSSYAFWVALASSIVVLVNALGALFGFSVNGDLITQIIMAIAGVLVVLGVVSMPSGSQTDSDDESDQQDSSCDEQDEEDDDCEE